MKLTADNIHFIWQLTLFILCVAIAVWYFGDLDSRMIAPVLKPVITQPQQEPREGQR